MATQRGTRGQTVTEAGAGVGEQAGQGSVSRDAAQTGRGSDRNGAARAGRRLRSLPLLAGAAVVVVAALVATVLLAGPTATPVAACPLNSSHTSLAAGQCAPNFTLADIHGRPVSLSSFRGHPVLLHFWAVNCTTCAAEYPDFSRAVHAYAHRGLAVVAVDAWGEIAPLVIAWQNRHHLPATMLVDTSQAVPTLYRGTGTPTTYFIDRAGRITFSANGPLSYAAFQRQISRIM